MHFKALTVFWAAFLFLQITPHVASAASLPEDSSSATIYAYFNIGGDGEDASATISQDSFAAQTDEMTKGGYHVMALPDLLKAQSSGTSLPRRTISLTFEMIDATFLKAVLPLLTEKKLPVTIFISPGQIDQKETSLTWDDVRTLRDNDLVTLGLTAYNYSHIAGWPKDKLTADLNQARSRFREELSQDAQFFAYPYGEYSADYRALIEQQGFTAAFSQQSGVTYKDADALTLPRFTMTEDLSDLDRFRMTSDALPFPVSDVEPSSMLLTVNPPFPGFTVPPAITSADLKTMTCFASGVGKLSLNLLGNHRIEMRFPQGFDDTRGRVNCTLPVKISDDGGDTRWRWLGFLYSVPAATLPQ